MNRPHGLALLHRFFFYGWLFRDASVGNMWERAAALAHNREQARWLPTYLRRWLLVAGVSLAIAAYCEHVLASPFLSAPFYVLTAITIVINAVTAACWRLLQAGC